MIAPVARDLDALLAALRSYPPGGDRISGIPRVTFGTLAASVGEMGSE